MCRWYSVIVLGIAIVFASIELSVDSSKIEQLDVVIMVDQSVSLQSQENKDYHEILKKCVNNMFEVGADKTKITLLRCGMYDKEKDAAVKQTKMALNSSVDMNEIEGAIDEIKKLADNATKSGNKELLHECVDYVDGNKDLDGRPEIPNVLIYFGDAVHDRAPIHDVMGKIQKRFKVFYFQLPVPQNYMKYYKDYYKPIIDVFIGNNAKGLVKIEPKVGCEKNIIKTVVGVVCKDILAGGDSDCSFDNGKCQTGSSGKNGEKYCEYKTECDSTEQKRCCKEKFEHDMKCGCDGKWNMSEVAKKAGCDTKETCVPDKKECENQLKKEPENDKMPIIIGAAVAGIALLLLIILIVVCVVVSKRRSKKAKEGKKGREMSLKEAKAAERARGVHADLETTFETKRGGKSMKTAKEPSQKSKLSKKGDKGEDTTSTKTATKSTVTKTKSTITKSKATSAKSKSTASKKGKK